MQRRPDETRVRLIVRSINRKLTVCVTALTAHLPEKQSQEVQKRRSDLLRRTIQGVPDFIRNMPLLELSRVGSLMYSEDFRTGRTLFSEGALMADEIDVLIRQRTVGKKRLRDSFHAMIS